MSRRIIELEEEIKIIENELLELKSLHSNNPFKKVKINSEINKKEKELLKTKRQLQEANKMKYYFFGYGVIFVVIIVICIIGAMNEGNSYIDNDNSEKYYEHELNIEQDNTNENTQSEYTNKEDEEKNELDDTNISKDTFSFDIAFYRSTKTEKIFYIFDSSNNKVIYLIHGRKTNTYHEGTYSGDLDSEFDVTIVYDNSENSFTRHFKRNGRKIEIYYENGSVDTSYSSCSIDDAKKYLLETDYFN